LAAAGRQAGLKFDWEQLVRAPSPTNGFSLAELQELAKAAGLATRAVRAAATENMPVPAVAHLHDGHFVAVLAVEHGRCRIFDPGLKAERQLLETEFAEVASGHFLALAGARLPGTTDLTPAQAQAVRGRTSSCPPNDDEDGGSSGGPCEPDEGITSADHAAGTKPPACPVEPCRAPGMAAWSVTEPYVNLWLTDVPLRYQPTKGPRIAPRVVYKQRAENGPAGLSGTWMLGWFSRGTVELQPQPLPGDYSNPENWSSFTVTMPSGARRTFTFEESWSRYEASCACWTHGYGSTSTQAPDGAYARKEANNTLIVGLADGRVFKFGTAAGFPGVFLLQSIQERGGLSLSVTYGTDNLPTHITDADNRTTALTYTTVGGKKLLYRVTTPDTYYCEFGYGLFGPSNTPLLTSIRDAVGIVSAIGYVAQGGNYLPQTLTTPYGTTTFELSENQGIFNRLVKVTLPNGDRQLVASSDYGGWDAATEQSIPPWGFLAEQLPAGAPDPNTGEPATGTGTIQVAGRAYNNTFRWEESALARIATTVGMDYSLWRWRELKRAEIRHWLNVLNQSTLLHANSVLNHRQEPSPAEDANGEPIEGGITFYDYAGKPAVNYPGTRIWPSVTLQRLPGLNESTWRYEERNDDGWLLKRKSTYTLANGTLGVRVDATFEYDSFGNVLREKDAAGLLRREYQWNTYRRRTLQRDYHVPAANSSNPAHYYETTFQYDATTQRMTQRVAPTGLTTTWAYSGGGNPGSYTVVETQSPITLGANTAASRQQTSVVTDGLLTSHTDWRGLTRTFQYDGLGRLKKTLWPDATFTETGFTRTVNGQPQMLLDPVTERDRLGNVSSNAYDGLRRRVAVTDARSNTTTFTYCGCGSPATITDPLGNKTIHTYDYAGRRTKTESLKPDNTVVATTTYAYDLLGRQAAVTDAAGTRTFSYNHQGLAVGVTQDGKLFGRTVYDADDRAATVVDRNGVAVTQTFDGLGRLKTRTDPNGGVSTYNYSARGLTSLVNELNKTTTYNYDAAGRKISEVTPNNETVSYTYNAAGDLLTLTDGRGKVTTWTYDAGNEGRLWKKRYAGDAFDQTVYGYNAGGQLTSRRYYSNSSTFAETLYTYDGNGNVTLVNYPAGTTDIALVYDANNRVTSMTDASGTTAYTYTAWGALLTEDGPWTGTTDRLTYAYDLARRRTGLTLDQPNGGTFAHTYAYDAAGRMNSVVSPAGTTAYGFLAASHQGDNYASDRRTLIDYPGVLQIDQDFTDPLKRLKNTALKNNGTTVNSHAYLYNAGSQRTKQTLTDGSYVDYAYDNLGQLDTALTKTSGGSAVTGQQFDYAYDAGWNLTTRATGSGTTTYVPNDRNQLSTAGGWAQGYDAAGNRTSENTGTTSSLSYTYDAENQLTSVATDSYGTPEGSRWKLEFTYDGRGRLRKRVDYFWLSGTGWYANGDTRYVYDGMLLLQQRSGGNVPQVSYTRGPDLSGSLAGAGGIGGLLARSTHSTVSPYPLSTSAYYHADGNGNVTYLLRSDAGAHARYQYDPYGRTLSATGTLASANLLRFSSKPVVLSATGAWGCYYFGYRFYDPGTQRWLNRDPIGEDGDLNIYAYADNEPASLSDPYGLTTMTAPWITAGALNPEGIRLLAMLADAGIVEYSRSRSQRVSDQQPRCNGDKLDRCLDECVRTVSADPVSLQACYCQCHSDYPKTPRGDQDALKKEWSKNNMGKPWPKGKIVHHKCPLADGGADSWENIIPMDKDDHVKHHTDDRRRWGRRSGRGCPGI
jgi:RHS repeat-associated protein